MKKGNRQKAKKEMNKKSHHLQKKRGDRHKQQRNEAKWKNHYQIFDDMLKDKGLRLEDIDGDGNCLFRAVSDQLFGHQHRHGDLRKICVDFMADEKDRLQYFLDEDDMKFDDYVQWIAKDGNWAGYFEIYCLCQLLKINFRLILKDGSLIPMHHFDMARSLVLAFHEDEANGIPEHYSSVRLVDDSRTHGLTPQINLALLEALKSSKNDDLKIVIPESSDEEEPKLSKRKEKKESKKSSKKDAKKDKKNSKGKPAEDEQEHVGRSESHENDTIVPEYIDISDDELQNRLEVLGF